jgi:sugar/nucleoside kinase (ribokinase family)
MKPAKAARFVYTIREKTRDVTLSMSTWIGYIDQPRGRRLLRKLAAQVDFFMLNESEAKALAQTSYLSAALETIQARTLVVTMGKLGAVVGGVDRDPQMVPALSVPTEKVVDTTGAGDTWNGAFLAAYLKTGDLMRSITAASIVSSIKCSRWGFDALDKLSFHKPADVVAYVLALREGSMQKKILDFG